MVVVTSKILIPLDGEWSLHVVNSGPNSEVILSFNEGAGTVRERITIHLTQRKAMQIARALAGVTLGSLPESE